MTPDNPSARATDGDHKLVAYGLRTTVSGRFTIVEVVTHRRIDMVGGRRVLLGRYTTHRGLPGGFKQESVAEARAREMATAARVEFVGFRADSI
jgi:hypothetical protein